MVAAGSITVAVRVRPPTAWEAARLPEICYEASFRGDGALSTPARAQPTAMLRDVVQIVDDRILTFDPDEKDQARAFVERGFLPPGTKRYKDRRFMFDKVFSHEAQQRDVYDATAQPLLTGLFDGYNATVFAYGATGCGKTHTISGTETDPGVIYLTMADLFQRIEDRKDEWDTEVVVSFLEIYNEEIRDLLAEPNPNAPRGGLSIREDKTVKVIGLAELKPKSAEEVKQIVLQGNVRRTQSPTHANETSSRSHAVLQVHVTQSPRTASLTEQRTMATLSIIDLAGSERAAATTNMGQRMVEGANINKSLLALGNCINALCESGGAVRHVPYRNSKLTRLLKFSLGGNCKTVMIVCVAPTSNHFDDTHNTLIYAERATKIKTKVVTRNVVNVDRHVGRYVEAINRLNQEVQELRAKISGKAEAENAVIRRKRAEANAEVERAKGDIKAKVEQTKDSIMSGARCNGAITAAKIKLAAIRARLTQINNQALSGTLSTDLQVEKTLLQALAEPEEQVTKGTSSLMTQLQRASNSSAMFEATMRAVSERKSDRLDELSIENVKLEAMCKGMEMERVKSEKERDVMQGAVEGMANIMVNLVGMLGRCTVVAGEAAEALSGTPDTSDVVVKVTKALESVRKSNDEAFKKLIGVSTEEYTTAIRNAPLSLEAFDGYATSFTRRISSGPAVLQRDMSTKPSRRPSAFDTNNLSAPDSHRPLRSPRRSLRASLSQPYRRLPDREKRGLKGSKSVQWKDEVGKGEIDDGGLKSSSIAVSIIPASPETDASISTPSSSVNDINLTRSTSLGSSESDWEDEADKVDESMHLSFSASLPASTKYDTSGNCSAPGLTRRKRPSHLDPNFLKSRSRSSALGSLVEGDESSPERRSHPLSDRSNDLLVSGDRSFSTYNLHVPKGRDRNTHGSPKHRGPSTPKRGGITPGSGQGGKLMSGRRRSNIGLTRNERGRRRSSMIPQLSPPNGEGNVGPRRFVLASPAKRIKRVSLTKSVNAGTLKVKSPPSGMNLSVANIYIDANADTSFSRTRKATWR